METFLLTRTPGSRELWAGQLGGSAPQKRSSWKRASKVLFSDVCQRETSVGTWAIGRHWSPKWVGRERNSKLVPLRTCLGPRKVTKLISHQWLHCLGKWQRVCSVAHRSRPRRKLGWRNNSGKILLKQLCQENCKELKREWRLSQLGDSYQSQTCHIPFCNKVRPREWDRDLK